ncbi:amidohydrolase [Roseomonas sp. KE2513]|uniref:amidohydrolase family protein n=1 Tax=Roseomonas sp. KE2513 TaxID=2479202 RepID=UPI0018DF2968|nr:amidohydrolase family protein [Roseomonas sp. KE2513]MBI0539001.1 amidohydrolase [Roseomonas sp. KE2513]
MSSAVIDAHHHVWRQADLDWLQGEERPRIFGPYRPIMRDYLVEEFIADAAPSGVARSVYVQANWPNSRAFEEAAWVQGEGERAGMIGGIIAFADFADPGVGAHLDRLRALPALRGVRQQLHWHRTPLYQFAARPNLSDDPDWRRGFALLAPTGLLFELQVFAGQANPAERLVRDFPDQTFVLEHAGMLEDRSDTGWAEWRGFMARLAQHPNVCTKLSGLGTFLRAARAEDWAPVVRPTLDLFGPERCLFGSNFPIEKLWTSYADLFATFSTCIDHLDEAGRRAVLHDTAARLYSP